MISMRQLMLSAQTIKTCFAKADVIITHDEAVAEALFANDLLSKRDPILTADKLLSRFNARADNFRLAVISYTKAKKVASKIEEAFESHALSVLSSQYQQVAA